MSANLKPISARAGSGLAHYKTRREAIKSSGHFSQQQHGRNFAAHIRG